MDIYSLIKNSEAYKIFLKDKYNDTISHATLIECDDEVMLNKYVKIFVQTLVCQNGDRCGTCRTCKLIESDSFSDVEVYPKGKKIVVSDVDDLIEKSYLKPLEKDFKVFVLNSVQDMNVLAQNKLLKTLEEPPKNTFIIMGTTTVYPLLTTILSRVKRLTIGSFSDAEILSCLKDENYDIDKLNYDIKFSSGKLGEVISRYNSSLGKEVEDLVKSFLLDMKTSKTVSLYSSKINKENLKEILSVLNITLIDIVRYKLNQNVLSTDKDFLKIISDEFSFNSITFISDKLRECEKALNFNGNVQTIADKILFAVVEGRHK